MPDPLSLSRQKVSSAPNTPSLTRWAVRALCLGALLAAELIVAALSLTYWFGPRFNWDTIEQLGGWLALVHFHDGIFAGLIAAVMVITILGWETLRAELQRAAVDGTLPHSKWQMWLAFHLAAVVCLSEWTSRSSVGVRPSCRCGSGGVGSPATQPFFCSAP